MACILELNFHENNLSFGYKKITVLLLQQPISSLQIQSQEGST
jgi:hypothetical protein